MLAAEIQALGRGIAGLSVSNCAALRNRLARF